MLNSCAYVTKLWREISLQPFLSKNLQAEDPHTPRENERSTEPSIGEVYRVKSVVADAGQVATKRGN